MLITFSTKEETYECIEFLKEKKIYVKGPWPAPWDDCITITLGPKEYMDRFIENIKLFMGNK